MDRLASIINEKYKDVKHVNTDGSLSIDDIRTVNKELLKSNVEDLSSIKTYLLGSQYLDDLSKGYNQDHLYETLEKILDTVERVYKRQNIRFENFKEIEKLEKDMERWLWRKLEH